VEKELKNNSNKIETWKEREKSLRMDIDCALISCFVATSGILLVCNDFIIFYNV
jgi:hypothetical protein